MRITISGKTYNASFPVGVTETHEGGLDQASVKIRHIEKEDAFLPFTPVNFLNEWWVIARDDVVREKYIGKATHTIMLLEVTKRLERVICGAKTFTKPLKTTYVSAPVIPQCTKYVWRENMAGIKSPETQLPVGNPYNDLCYVVAASGETVNSSDYKPSPITSPHVDCYVLPQTVFCATSDSSRAIEGSSISVSDAVDGTYEPVAAGDTITYDGTVWVKFEVTSFSTSGSTDNINYDYERDVLVYPIVISKSAIQKKPLSVWEVTQRLLLTAETVRSQGECEYHHSVEEEGAIDTRMIESPEFSFANGATLKENLDQIAKVLHAKVKMRRVDEQWQIYFVPLSTNQMATIKGTLIGDETSFDTEKYAGRIQTNAANLVIQDAYEGAVAEPCGIRAEDTDMIHVPMKTLRCSDAEARINETTGEIETVLPIRKVTRLLVKPYAWSYPVDITPYVNEKARYLALSNYEGEYSKLCSLYYTQGDRNIRGLFEKSDETYKHDAFKDYSIINVINQVSDSEVSLSAEHYKDLSFFVEYEPYLDIRLVNSRTDGKGDDITYIANQAANEIDKDALSDFVRGTIEQMASDSPKKCYLMRSIDMVPSVGTMFDEKNYISEVSYEIYPYFVKCMISISEHYNRLGQHVEVPNAVRQYEIDVNNIYNRSVLYTDVCRLAFTKWKNDRSILSTASKKMIVYGVARSVEDKKDNTLSLAEVATYAAHNDPNELPDTEDAKLIKRVLLPVANFGFGNSIVFVVPFRDNFSAGSYAISNGYGVPSGANIQGYTTYGDTYGDAEFMTIKLYNGMYVSGDGTNIVGRSLPNNVGTEDGATKGAIGLDSISKTFPELRYIQLHKDSRERIIFTYQLLFQSDDGIIIGNALGTLCPLVCNWSQKTIGNGIFLYGNGSDGQTYLNPVTGKTSAKGIHYDITYSPDELCVMPASSLPAHSAWAIIKDGQFVIGSNSPFPKGGKLYFNFDHE